jgi:hypothetical protein
MTLSDDMKTTMTNNAELMAVLTGGVFNDVEELSRQGTPGAFDATTKEIKPCALIKYGTEIPLSAAKIANAVQTPLTIYFYERAGYANIEPAMGLTFDLLNDSQVGTNVWRIEFDVAVYQQRDTALDCPLGSLRFVAKRLR